MGQKFWLRLWFKIYEHFMTLDDKKYYRHRKNGPTEQSLTWCRVLRVIYTNLSIINQLC